ncbi:C40 family peptidase [Spirillospora sp. NBC_01491]|uniref:C40 family peptidase n=1 Tax=Spirillospora sp. NBC_01491 TaxID=2976007 RepID=UPI002E2FD02D|nr:CHAP domain-containing protein [Spirillospora sp. NBC_01491]
MGSAAGMLAAARKSLNMSGRPNAITRDYASRHGNAFLDEAWCDMGVTYWARHSDNAGAVLPGGDRAYTVWHAQDFQKINSWHVGTTAEVNAAKPGDIVFFDWGETNKVGAIDHVGVIEKVLGGGRVQTIEANTSNACKRRVRGSDVIAGYGRPNYSGGSSATDWMEAIVNKLPMLAKGAKATNEHVQTARGLLLARSHPEIGGVAGAFDARMDTAVRAVQKWGKVEVDGVIGPVTWSVLMRVH